VDEMIKGYLPYGANSDFGQQLEAAGCHVVVAEEQMNGRPALDKLVSDLQEGDVLVICNAAHAGSQADFVQLLIRAGQQHAHLVSIAEDIDTLRDTLLFGIGATH